MVVWEDDRNSGLEIYGQTVAGFDPFGTTPLPPRCLGIDPGDDDKIISNITANESTPAIANDSENSRFMVAWNRHPIMPYSASVVGKIIDAGGNEYKAMFDIASTISSTCLRKSSVAYDRANQRYNVTFQGIWSTQYNVHSNLYDAEGNSLASVFTTNGNEKSLPKIVYTSPPYLGADEEWLLAWQETDIATSSKNTVYLLYRVLGSSLAHMRFKPQSAGPF